MKIYLSGPITDDPDYMQHFAHYAQKLKAKGHTVLDPTVWTRENLFLKYNEYMHLDIAMLEVCDAIYMMPGWAGSKGARYEQKKAAELKLKIFYADEIQLPIE